MVSLNFYLENDILNIVSYNRKGTTITKNTFDNINHITTKEINDELSKKLDLKQKITANIFVDYTNTLFKQITLSAEIKKNQLKKVLSVEVEHTVGQSLDNIVVGYNYCYKKEKIEVFLMLAFLSKLEPIITFLKENNIFLDGFYFLDYLFLMNITSNKSIKDNDINLFIQKTEGAIKTIWTYNKSIVNITFYDNIDKMLNNINLTKNIVFKQLSSAAASKISIYCDNSIIDKSRFDIFENSNIVGIDFPKLDYYDYFIMIKMSLLPQTYNSIIPTIILQKENNIFPELHKTLYLIIVLVSVILLNNVFKYYSADKSLQQIETQKINFVKKNVPDIQIVRQPYYQFISAVNNIEKEINNILNINNEKILPLQILNDIIEVNKNFEENVLNRFQYTKNYIIIEGVISSLNNLETFKNLLEDNNTFKKVDIINSEIRSTDKKINYNIQIKL